MKLIRTMFVSALFLALDLDFLTLQDKHNICTLLVNILLICAHCVCNSPEKLTENSLFYLFLKLVQINLIFTTNVHCIILYPAISTFAVQICYTNNFCFIRTR
jgi:hypothetical protein